MALVFRGGWVNIDGPETGIDDDVPVFSDINQSFVASEDIEEGRVVTVNTGSQLAKASTSDQTPIIGIVSGAITAGNSVSVVTFGSKEFAGWGFAEPGKPVYLTGNGELTQTMPISGLVAQVGIALSSTKIHVRPFPKTTLA